MTHEEAVQSVDALAEQFGVRLGHRLWEYQHPRTHVWCFIFAVVEDKPEWCWYCTAHDNPARPLRFVAIKRPVRFLS